MTRVDMISPPPDSRLLYNALHLSLVKNRDALSVCLAFNVLEFGGRVKLTKNILCNATAR